MRLEFPHFIPPFVFARAVLAVCLVASILPAQKASAQGSDATTENARSQRGDTLSVDGAPELETQNEQTLLELMDADGDQPGEFLRMFLKYKDDIERTSGELESARDNKARAQAVATFLSDVFFPLLDDLEESGFLEDAEVSDNETISGLLNVYEHVKGARELLELAGKWKQIGECVEAIRDAESNGQVLSESRRLTELLRPLRELGTRYPEVGKSRVFVTFATAYDKATELIGIAESTDAQIRAFRAEIGAAIGRDFRSELREHVRNYLVHLLIEAVNEEFDLGISANTVDGFDKFLQVLHDPLVYADLFVQSAFKQWFNENASYTYNVSKKQSVTIKLQLDQGTSIRIFSKRKQFVAPLRLDLPGQRFRQRRFRYRSRGKGDFVPVRGRRELLVEFRQS